MGGGRELVSPPKEVLGRKEWAARKWTTWFEWLPWKISDFNKNWSWWEARWPVWIAKPSSWTSSTRCHAGYGRWSRGSNSNSWIGSTGGGASGAKPSRDSWCADWQVDVWRGRIKCEVQPSSTLRWGYIYGLHLQLRERWRFQVHPLINVPGTNVVGGGSAVEQVAPGGGLLSGGGVPCSMSSSSGGGGGPVGGTPAPPVSFGPPGNGHQQGGGGQQNG